MKRRAGFTLIELLVVIAIIAILAAILFPVFSSAKNAGMKARCASNYKQILLALNSYLSDYNQRLPYVTYWNRLSVLDQLGKSKDTSDQRFIVDALGQYIKSQSIWLCPVYKATNRIPDCPPPFQVGRYSQYKWLKNGGRKGGPYENVASNTHYMYAVVPSEAVSAPAGFKAKPGFLTSQKTASDVVRPTKCILIVELPYWTPSPHLASGNHYGIHYAHFDGHVSFGITSSENTMWDHNADGWY